jgi:tyrosine-protein phosphatase YwqE
MQPAAARNGCSGMAPVHVLASDAHDDKYRVPVLSAAHAAVAKVFGLDVARALVDDNPQAIVNGHSIPFLSGG